MEKTGPDDGRVAKGRLRNLDLKVDISLPLTPADALSTCLHPACYWRPTCVHGSHRPLCLPACDWAQAEGNLGRRGRGEREAEMLIPGSFPAGSPARSVSSDQRWPLHPGWSLRMDWGERGGDGAAAENELVPWG